MDRRGARNVLWVAIVVCLVAGVAGAVRVGDDGARANGTTTGRDANAGAAAREDGPTGPGGGSPRPASADALSGARGGTTTSLPDGTPGGETGEATTGTTERVPAPARVTPPRAGAYSYRVTENGTPRAVTVRIEDRGPSLAGGAQRTVVTPMPGNGEVRDELTWGSTRVVVNKRTLKYPNYEGACDWDPDYLELQTGLAPGRQWKATASCTLTVFAEPKRTTREGTAKVVGARRLRIAGADLVVWLIERTTTTSDSDAATKTTATQWFSPERGLVVKETSKTSQTGEEERTTEIELLSLDPT